ncbi:hypothetical protein GUJ93_ZPchr0011g27108 [Zizania palustris]|uniref:Uncharacterized protein n=1 Tax=Zizania palustris TaxID=103762 RepID=A0A8J5WKI6_ZIZPA|nr:hypothetical protein GUJ93_ZPchr0011g27108 [Zizania palustris]
MAGRKEVKHPACWVSLELLCFLKSIEMAAITTASPTIVCRVLVIAAVAIVGLLFATAAAGDQSSKVHLDYDYAYCVQGCEWPECYLECRRVGFKYGRCYQNGPLLDCCCIRENELAPAAAAPAHAFLHP